MNKDLCFQRSGPDNCFDFFPGQLSGQYHPGKAQGLGQSDAGGRVNRHLGGGMERHVWCQLTHHGGHAPVLHNQGIHTSLAGNADTFPQAFQLLVKDQNIQCLMDADAAAVGIGYCLAELFLIKILAVFPGAEVFLSQVYCISAAADSCLQRLHGTGRSQDLQFCQWGFLLYQVQLLLTSLRRFKSSMSLLSFSFSCRRRSTSRLLRSASMRAAAASST